MVVVDGDSAASTTVVDGVGGVVVVGGEGYDTAERAMERNRMQRARLDTILTLSLHGEFLHPSGSSSSSSSSSSKTGGTSSTSTINLDTVDTADLIAVLKIRGNLNRRGHCPR